MFMYIVLERVDFKPASCIIPLQLLVTVFNFISTRGTQKSVKVGYLSNFITTRLNFEYLQNMNLFDTWNFVFKMYGDPYWNGV